MKKKNRGWGFSSVVERLPSKRKALGSVPGSEKKKRKKKKKNQPNTMTMKRASFGFGFTEWLRGPW